MRLCLQVTVIIRDSSRRQRRKWGKQEKKSVFQANLQQGTYEQGLRGTTQEHRVCKHTGTLGVVTCNTTKSSLDCEYLHVKDKNSEVLNFQRQINFTISSEPSTLFLPQTHRNNYITYEKIHLTFHLGLQSLGLQ